MINLATVTAAVKTLLSAGLTGYYVHRNAERNRDPNVAARGSGWINVTRGRIEYQPRGGMGNTPWLAMIEIRVEIQTASMKSDEDAEDKLQAAEADVLDVLTENKKLGNTVDMTNGYSIAYEYNTQERVWHHAAIITVMAEARTGATADRVPFLTSDGEIFKTSDGETVMVRQ